MRDYELVDLQLHKEELTKGAVSYYLSAVYRYEDNSGIYEVTIPKIQLPIHEQPCVKRELTGYHYVYQTINIGFGDMVMLNDESGNACYKKCIKEKIHDMTLEEIEKKLGYKVRVVSEKEK